MDTGKVILIAGGAYLVYAYFIAPSSTATATTAVPASAPTGTTAAPVSPVTAVANPVSAQQQQLAAVISALGTQGPNLLLTAGRVTSTQLYNVDQWNYYLNQVTGEQIGPDLTGYVPNAATGTMTVNQYWAALMSYASGAVPSYGLSGLGCGPGDPVGLAGLGISSQPGHGVSTRVPTDPQASGRFEIGGKDEWGWS